MTLTRHKLSVLLSKKLNDIFQLKPPTLRKMYEGQTKTKAYLMQHQSGQNKGLELFTASILSIYDWFS